MPLGSSVSKNIQELHHGPRYAANMAKFGKEKANQIAIAAAYSGARKYHPLPKYERKKRT